MALGDVALATPGDLGRVYAQDAACRSSYANRDVSEERRFHLSTPRLGVSPSLGRLYKDHLLVLILTSRPPTQSSTPLRC